MCFHRAAHQPGFSGGSVSGLPEKFALRLAPSGALVEKATTADPLDNLWGAGRGTETVLSDLLQVLETAAADDRVSVLVLEPEALLAADMVQIARLGAALTEFRATGKRVIASAKYYSQSQYLLASYADTLYMHPLGSLLLTGIASYRPYYAELLERLKVKVHVFRVGKFKSAIEPYTRNSMSEPAKLASSELLDQLWRSYAAQVTANRGLAEGALDSLINDYAHRLRAADGDMARLALENLLVDELLTPDAFEARIADELATSVEELDMVDANTYLATLTNQGKVESPNKIAVITLEGAISQGTNEPGQNRHCCATCHKAHPRGKGR